MTAVSLFKNNKSKGIVGQLQRYRTGRLGKQRNKETVLEMSIYRRPRSLTKRVQGGYVTLPFYKIQWLVLFVAWTMA